MGGLVTITVLAAYKYSMNDLGHVSKVDGAWRIVVGVALIPAFGTLYQRLTLPESTRFLASEKLKSGNRAQEEDAIAQLKQAQRAEEIKFNNKHVPAEKDERDASTDEVDDENAAPEALVAKKAHFKDFLKYFSEWKHAKLLIGTSSCWFLLDVAFYGINLNQNVVLQEIGYAGKTGTAWERLFRISAGGIIITALGFLPGYYVTILTIEKLGRKWIQIQGFLLAALLLGILAGRFETLSKPAFVALFTLLQFFFNFGANSTAYCYPAELFPTRYRASAHGFSAAMGKLGAITSALAFNTLSQRIGTPAVLWIFVGCCVAGAGFTLLLPEVMGRDPDLILAEEIKAAREAKERK